MEDFVPFVFVLSIIAGVFVFVIHLTRMSNEQKKAELKIKSGVFERENENEALRSELLELKERVATLEKIITDESYELKKEFAKLDAA